MKPGFRLLAWCAVCAFFLLSPPGSRAQEVGILEGLSGRVYWQKNASSPSVRLHPRRDAGRILRAQERVRCGRNGILRLHLFDRPLRIKGPSGWFTLPPPLVSESDPRRKALEAYGDSGGRDRGRALIYSPAPLARVRPATFEVRWTTGLAPGASVFVVREESRWGRELWRQRVGDVAAGRLASEKARLALERYRKEHGHGPLLLVLLDEVGREISSTTFYLLPERNEWTLSRELSFWGRQPARLWRHLGRAGAFVSQEMFVEAADEYEAALALTPESTDLLRRAIQAHRTTGNAERVDALMRRLPSGTPQP